MGSASVQHQLFFTVQLEHMNVTGSPKTCATVEQVSIEVIDSSYTRGLKTIDLNPITLFSFTPRGSA